MATQVLIAHTGQRLEVDAAQFSTLDDLKSWVARSSSVSLQHMVALTPQGRNVKFASLHSEKEIYIYDVRVTQQMTASGTPPLISDIPLPRRLSVPAAPNSIDDVQAISSWQHLYEERRSWALRLADNCSRTNSAVLARYDEIDVILKCLDAAVANLEISVKQIEPKYTELKKWVDPALSEHERLATEWEQYLALARNISVSPSMVKFMTRGEVTRADVTLEDLVEPETARKAGKLAPTARRRFGDKAAELDRLATQMYQGFEGLAADFDKLMGRSVLGHSTDSAQLLQDIEAVAGQIDADYHTSLSYGGSQRDLAQASKTASNHTERLVPSLKKRAKEMDEMMQYATRARNNLVHESVGFMQTITDITALHSGVKNQINILNQSEDDMTTFDYLRLIHQLPYMYASFVVEAIRRREWVDKIRTDSSTLANEMALFQDEEAKRRRRWQKMIGSMYGPSLDTTVVGLEVNLLGEDVPWPAMTKEELDEFLQSLQDQDTDPTILEDVGKLVQELNSPTKQQFRRLKAFKNGSVHEAALGRSGLMIRGDDELIRTLQEDKSKLEKDLRRASDGADSLLRRIEQLENELRDEKQRAAKFEKELSVRNTQHDDMKDQIQEVNSTKKDLLENMEALKREFLDERKSLEDEIKTLKARLEDTEDDMEHFGESRENEKAAYDEKIQILEAEIERLGKEREDDSLQAQGQVELLMKESHMQRNQLDAKLEAAQETVEDQVQALRKIHGEVAPGASLSASLVDLTDSLQLHAGDLLAKLRAAGSDYALVKADLGQALDSVKELEAEVSELNGKLKAAEEDGRGLRENLAEEQAKTVALEKEAAESRGQLSELRGQLSDGETGSETLRKKLEAEEKKTAELAEELASRQSHMGSLQEELDALRQKAESLDGKLSVLTSRCESRDGRTKDLTQRLYTQNDRLVRLLERIGYSVSREAGQMAINKIPRSERSAPNPNDSSDPGSNLRRSTSVGTGATGDNADLGLLYWMNSTDGSAEADKYDSFVRNFGSFDMDLFSDTLYLRIKEAEHKARKWQREARAYRDRAHTLQKDAHDKIAFRHFKEGDLALFLPTRNQQAGAWAAFNVGFPHYFLREQEAHRLRHREWLVARISRIQERVVDLSKSLQPANDAESMNEDENDNPFQLSDGLRWYLIDAHEDKPGAPSTPGMGKSTVAANNVEATADIQSHTAKGKGRSRDSVTSIEGINKTLSKSLDSRRSSSGSKKALPFPTVGGAALLKSSALASETNSLRAAAPDTPAGTSPVQGGLLTASNAHADQRARAEARRENTPGADTQKQAGELGSGGGKSSEVRNVDSLLGP
ncbi:autophagy-related protein [Hirsutella rhossiliensis]|uniref:Autophagy-related protein 11 n=1 Tax=Hirsutella rhossiliensis TaxID=111463 RepID=A0A9P8MXU4_9HYPO|nr:autophagy-related protein [Hirsutella rhossiliensis]KAH0963317.1 autophagy-related protein [Hirsutella rhossiliensis]